MYLNKIIIIGILLISVNVCNAYDDESGLEDNEYIDFIWNDELGCFEQKNIERPSIYQRGIYGIKKIWFTIKAFFITDVDLDVNYDIDKYSWNGNDYEQTDSAEFSIGVTHNANQTKTTVSTFDPVEEYFRDNETRTDDWKGDTDHPDILNVSVVIDGEGTALDIEDYGYVSISDSEVEKLVGGGVDYGFGDGKGSEGGTGIYDGINLYGSGEGDIDSSILSSMFFILIPLIFIFSVIKFIMKVS